MSENYNAFFNPEVESTEQKTTSTEYNPSAAKGKNGIYQSIIRFIPWWQDPKHGSIKDKWVCYLVDPVTDKGKYVDCPSSVGKPSPLQEMYFKLKKSENIKEQNQAAIFSRRHSYTSLIQVIRDENSPELEGKILPFRYGIKIWEKINSELKPLVGEKHDPFDVLNGKAFALIITKVSGFNNYDQSKFLDKKIPLCIPDTAGKLIPINSQTDKQYIFNWVKDNSPDLNKYDFQEWDSETFNYVNHIITSVTGRSDLIQKYGNVVNRASQPASGMGSVNESPGKNSAGISTSDISLDDLNINDGISVEMPDLSIPEMPNLGISGDLDDIIAGT